MSESAERILVLAKFKDIRRIRDVDIPGVPRTARLAERPRLAAQTRTRAVYTARLGCVGARKLRRRSCT